MSKVLIEINAIPSSGPGKFWIGSETTWQEIERIELSSVDEIMVNGFVPDDDRLSILFSILKPKGKLAINGGIIDRSSGQAVVVELRIQGFVDIMAAKDTETGERFVVAQKPDWDVGSVAELSIIKASVEDHGLSPGDHGHSHQEYVDEDELLNDGISAPSTDPSICADESNSKKRACKNCSCGLAEIEAAEAAASVSNGSSAPVETKKSACGNCYKGDAFRCASCPFLGQPAFEPSDGRVVLSVTDDF